VPVFVQLVRIGGQLAHQSLLSTQPHRDRHRGTFGSGLVRGAVRFIGAGDGNLFHVIGWMKSQLDYILKGQLRTLTLRKTNARYGKFSG
jgi:hypothetical protein